MSTVLVTGGAGYIGSHACKALARAGYRPVALDNLVYGHEWAVKWGPLVTGDIADPVALDAAFEEHRPVAVMHFAAYAYVGESVADPAKYYRNNVAGTLNLLEGMRRHDCRRLVFSSTCATYGLPDRVPISEELPQRPVNPYGWSKWMVEQLLRDFEQAYGMHHVSLRYFNAAGADADGELGEQHEPETHLIPLVIEAALGRRERVELFGTDYPTDDGSAVRDYVHVEDLADAHVRALSYLLGGGSSVAVNLGTGRGHSVREVIAAVERVSGREVPVRESPRRPGDPPVLVAAARRAWEVLGWQPAYRELEPIVRTAWHWHQRSHTASDALEAASRAPQPVQ